MTEKSDQIEQSRETNLPPSTLSMHAVGRLLVESREKMGLSVDEVGSRLRLTPRQVEAMESGNIDALPGPAFVRGFLRNYAKLLQIDAEPLLEACRTQVEEAVPKKISLHSENIQIAGRARKGWTIYLAATAIVILLLAAWFAYMDMSAGKSEPAPEPETDATMSQELPGTALDQQILPLPQAPVTGPVPSVDESAAAVPMEPAATSDANPAPASGVTANVVLSSTQTSWVSITDRDGKEIFGRNVNSGTSETVTGQPPLKVVIGNATGMQVTFNGSPVDIAPHIRSNVARLTLE